MASVDLTELADAAIAADVVSLRRSMDRLDGVFAEWSAAAQGRGVGLADGHGDGTAPEDCDGLTLSPLLDGRCAVRGELWGSARASLPA